MIIFNVELFHKKNILVICFIFIMGPIYLMLLTVANNTSGFTLVNIGVCLLLTVFFLYTIKILSTMIEYLLIKGFTTINLKYKILYPFTIDDKVNFKPFILLMNPETIRDIAPLNLIFHNKNGLMNGAKLKDDLRILLRINTISDIVAYVASYLIINLFFAYDFSIALSISFIAAEAQKSLSDGIHWKGLKYIYKENSIIKYLYSFPNVKEMDAEDYADYLASYRGDLDLETTNSIENYLLQSIHERTCYLDSYKLDELLIKWYENDEYSVLKSVTFINVIKLIGLLSLKSKNGSYLALFNKHIDLTIKHCSRSENEYEFLNPYIYYINGKSDDISLYHNFDSNRKTIFSYRTKLEKSIFVKSE